MSWITYLLEANLYLAVFYLLYYFIFRRETHYQLNRAYLLISSITAFILPVLQLGILKPNIEEIEIEPIVQTFSAVNIKITPVPVVSHWNMGDYLTLGYVLIVMVLFVNLFFKIYKLVRLSRSHKNMMTDNYKLIETTGEHDAFSFFNYLFVNADLAFKQTVIKHELIHIRQKHSWDILFVEILKIIGWFNPIVYLLQYSIKELHEFIADRETARDEHSTVTYANFLINNAYGINNSSLINTFFSKSLLKKRIIMLHQKRSGNLARLKYLVALPVCAGLLCASTLGFSKTYGWVDLAPANKPIPLTMAPQHSKKDTVITKVDNTHTTSKGYKFQETGYLINNKTNYRVVITEKNGEQRSFFKNSSSPAELRLLKEKYGYTFPAMALFAKLPPPPPVSPKIPPPPPPLPPRKAKNKKISVTKPVAPITIDEPAPPPPPPAQLIINDPDSSKAAAKENPVKSLVVLQSTNPEKPIPAIFVNGQRYNLKERLKTGQHVYITASDSVVVYSAGDANARKKYGDAADKGVVEIHGTPTFTIK